MESSLASPHCKGRHSPRLCNALRSAAPNPGSAARFPQFLHGARMVSSHHVLHVLPLKNAALNEPSTLTES